LEKKYEKFLRKSLLYLKGGIVEIGKLYLIIYDDKGFHPVKKIGIVKDIKQNLITLDNGEVLNSHNIIRAQIIKRRKDE